MTIHDFLWYLALHPLPVALWLAAVPLATLAWSVVHPGSVSTQTPWRQGFGVLTYLACVPGILSLFLLAYGLLFLHQNLLTVDLLSTFGPLVSMVLTLGLIRRRLTFAQVPGFGRLSALMMLITLSFAAAFVLERTRFLVGFFGSIEGLMVVAAAAFAAFKAAGWALFRGKKA